MRFSQLTLSGVAIFTGIAAAHPYESLFETHRLGKRVVSPDETCGNVLGGNNKGYSCGASNVGPCCSQYGWCGSSTDHCGTGCQSQFGTCSPASSSTVTTAVPRETGVVTDPYICGPTNQNMVCSSGCCSQYGYCGTTTDYCGGGCQPLYGTCDTTSGDDGTCGPANGGKKCATGRCCSAEGNCGTGSDYCQSPACLVGYGTCDADMVPPGSSTIGIPRPLLGSVQYGMDIYDCEKPGTVALTYDDGPLTYTAYLLDLLKSRGATATFFMTGVSLSKGRIDDPTTPWPAIVKRMAAEGHQIAGHTWSHADLSTLTDADRTTEMVKLEMAFRNILGYFPTYMRPPYSSCNAACMATMKTLGYHISSFNLDTEDYLHTTPETQQLAKNIVKTAIQGSNPATDSLLSIMHDIHYQTVYNLTSYFLDTLQAKGFKAVTMGECLNDPKANWYRSAGDSSVSPTSSSTSTTRPATTTVARVTTTRVSSTKISTTTKPSSTKISTTTRPSSTKTSAAPTPTPTCAYRVGNWCPKTITKFVTKTGCLYNSDICIKDATETCPSKAGPANLSKCNDYKVKFCNSLKTFCNTCTICKYEKWDRPIRV